MEITKRDLLNGLSSKSNPVTEAADNNLSKVGDIKLYKLDQKTIGILTDKFAIRSWGDNFLNNLLHG